MTQYSIVEQICHYLWSYFRDRDVSKQFPNFSAAKAAEFSNNVTQHIKCYDIEGFDGFRRIIERK